MPKVLSDQFVTSFLIPYIKGTILGHVEKDPIIQKIFTTEVPLEDHEKVGLETNPDYAFRGTIFENDQNLRRVFWNEFTKFIRMQRKICMDNYPLLTLITLPNPVTHVYSTEAEQNLFKFSYQVVNAVQNHKIAKLINNKEINGEFNKKDKEANKNKANDLRSKLEQNKLVIVQDKDGMDMILEEDEVSRGLSNDYNRENLYSNLSTEGSGEGRVVFADEIPPQQPEGQPKPPKQGIALKDLKIAIYENQARAAELILEESEMFVVGKMTADETGTARGKIMDKRTKEWLNVETNVSKPGLPQFRFVFPKQPGSNLPEKSFNANKDEIKRFFKDEKMSAREACDAKEKEKIENPPKVPARAAEIPPKKTETPGKVKTGLEAVSPIPAGQAQGNIRGNETFGGKKPFDIRGAKQSFFIKKYRKIIKAARAGQMQSTAPGPTEEEYTGAGEAPVPETQRTGELAYPVPSVPEEPKQNGVNPKTATTVALAAGLGAPIISAFFT